MATYKNSKTGATIEINSRLKGGDWKEIRSSGTGRKKQAVRKK